MSRKRREKPYSYSSARKRCCNITLLEDTETVKCPATVLVTGIPKECSVMELKSRFQIYGCVSRTTVLPTGGIAYLTFRSSDSALSAVNSASDPSFPITLHSLPGSSLLRVRLGATAKLLPYDLEVTSSSRGSNLSHKCMGRLPTLGLKWPDPSRNPCIEGALSPGPSFRVQVTWATNSVPLLRENVSQKDISPNSFSSKFVRPEVPLSRHGRVKRLGSAIVNPRGETTDCVPATVAFKGREIIAYDDIL